MFLRIFERVRDHIPLKQGLRQNFLFVVNAVDYVRDHIPLKQGLRLLVESVLILVNHTRSETIFH